MPPPPSPAATGRRVDLLVETRDRLQAHAPLVDALEAISGIDDGAAVILPKWYSRQWYADATDDAAPSATRPDPPPVVIAYGLVTGDSTWDNAIEDKTFALDVLLEYRPVVARAVPARWPYAICDELDAALTGSHGRWQALGKSGGTDEPHWNDDLARFQAVETYQFRRRDARGHE